MQSIWRDLIYGLRWWARSPTFSVIAILMLAFGIGANTAIFSFVDALLLRRLEGVDQPKSLIHLLRTNDNIVSDSLSYPDCRDFQNNNNTLNGIAMYWRTSSHLSFGQEAERLKSALITGNYFEILGVKAAIGRLLTSSDVRTEGAAPVVILSYNLWSNRFGRDPAIIGKAINLNGLGYTVLGVTAKGFSGIVIGERTDAWIPITMWRQADPDLARSAATWHTNWFHDRDAAWLQGFGRLKPGIALQQAQADLSIIAQRLAREYPQTNQKVGVRVASDLGMPPYIRSRVSQFAEFPLVVAGIVLLVVCANVAGMLLTKATARQREMGIRLAMGATRWHIMRQLLVEGILLAIAGGLAGWFLGTWCSHWLLDLLPETFLEMPLNLTLGPDARVFGFTLAIATFTGVLFSLAPARQLLRLDLIPLMKNQADGRSRVWRIRLRDVLTVTQIALSVLLLVIAGLCIRTLQNARGIDTGFDAEHVLTAKIDLGRQRYTEGQGRALYRSLIERMETVPGVRIASLALNIPLAGLQVVTKIYPEGRLPQAGRPQISYNVITSRYFETVGISLLRGRLFSEQDTQQSSQVAIVNERLARHFWPNENPIGKRFRFGDNTVSNPLIEIVGLVSDTRVADLFAQPRMYIYFPLTQRHQEQVILHLRADQDPERLTTAVRSEFAAIDPSLPVYDVKAFARYIDDAITPQRLAALLSSAVGALALMLAATGLYGRMAYDVEQRTREIGIRMALGAQPRDLLALVIEQGLVLASIGVGFGLIVALGVTRLIKSLLFGVSATDASIFAVISLLLMTISTLACYIPARRAIRVDPHQLLRYE